MGSVRGSIISTDSKDSRQERRARGTTTRTRNNDARAEQQRARAQHRRARVLHENGGKIQKIFEQIFEK